MTVTFEIGDARYDESARDGELREGEIYYWVTYLDDLTLVPMLQHMCSSVGISLKAMRGRCIFRMQLRMPPGSVLKLHLTTALRSVTRTLFLVRPVTYT